jgi:hypothetical protein
MDSGIRNGPKPAAATNRGDLQLGSDGFNPRTPILRVLQHAYETHN